MVKAYIYNKRSMKAVAVISGKQETVDKWLDDHWLDECLLGCDMEKFLVTQSPAFGFANGLRGINKTARYINLDEGE